MVNRMNNKKYLSSKQIKNELLNMLKEFDEWMRTKNIEYSIFGGTLLGAVRHGNIIPWDDDIDICLDRHSYNRFISVVKGNNCELTSNLYVAGFELRNSDIPFLKIYTKKVKCLESVFPNNNQLVIETNLWLDVFPIDGTPKYFSKLYDNVLNYIKQLYNEKRMVNNNWDITYYQKSTSFCRIKKTIKRNAIKLLPYNLITRFYIWFSSLFDFNKCSIVCENIWGIGLRESFSRELMNDYIDYNLGRIRVRGMKGGKEWLRIRYGDFMKLPPKNERESHGIIAWNK